MFDQDLSGTVEFQNQFPGRVGIQEIVVADLLAVQDLRARNTARRARREPVQRASLVRVFSVTQVSNLLQRQRLECGKTRRCFLNPLRRPGAFRKICRDGAVVAGSTGEGLLGQHESRCGADPTLVAFQFFLNASVVARVRDCRDKRVVLGGGPHHARPSYVDLLHDLVEGRFCSRHRFAKRIKVDYDHVDGSNSLLAYLDLVRRPAPNGQQAAMNSGVQSLHAAVEDFREAGVIGYLLDRDAGCPEMLCGAARGQQLHVEFPQDTGKVGQTGFVGNAQKGAPNGN